MGQPITITLPPVTAALLEELVELVARRNGESVEDVRRGVELSIVSRGLQSLQQELGHDSETLGAVIARTEGRVA